MFLELEGHEQSGGSGQGWTRRGGGCDIGAGGGNSAFGGALPVLFLLAVPTALLLRR
ncbi:hypothetical protein [Aminiphilus circumscriptus]|uniref:hypothetical protein n=1 Tax=Aminiphilus circumscriptus TaxID=290732 RepID=UPI0004AD1120|nr:hypothetical protein [Aminiphilus circumscriptus]